MVPFKRETSTLEAGTYPTTKNGLVEVDSQTVKLIKEDGEDGEGEPLWIVELGGVSPVRLRVPAYELNPAPNAPATNEELITHMFKRASTPMVHAFVFDALAKHADAVLENADQVRAEMKNSMVHPDAWLAAAAEVKEGLDARFGK